MNLLQVEKVTKHFGGVQALAGVSLDVEEGKLTSLIGPNGSGKTTLFNLITGIYQPTSGNIGFANRELRGLSSYKICLLGISRTFQIQQLFNELTALENVMVGCHSWSSAGFLSTGFCLPRAQREERSIIEESEKILGFLGLAERGKEKAQNLSYGEQRLLEIGKGLAARPRLLLLDEPAAGLNKQETAMLGKTLRKIIERGVTILLVEHDMSLVMGVSDYIVVFHQGQNLCAGEPGVVSRDPRVIAAYLGGDAGGIS